MLKLVVGLLIFGSAYSEAATINHGMKTLRMALVLFRHGDRSPISSYDSDPHRNYPWIGGFLALQPKGVEQMYELGLNLRNRYGMLVPSHGMYTSNTTLVLSSASERCILTAQSLLAAFYRPPKDAVKISIAWQPVPVTVLKPQEDIILGQRRNCPKLNAVRDNLLSDPIPEFKKWVQDGTVLKEYVSEHIGEELPSFRHLMEIFDALQVYSNHGLKLPSWSDNIFPNQTSKFVHWYQLTFSATDELKRIRGGAILNELLGKMKLKRDGNMQPDRTLIFYSGHDVTQTNLYNTMGLEELLQQRPGYGATIVFELHNTAEADLEVRMVQYPNTETKEPIDVKIPNCDKPCTLKNFELSVSHMLLDDYDRACSINE